MSQGDFSGTGGPRPRRSGQRRKWCDGAIEMAARPPAQPWNRDHPRHCESWWSPMPLRS
jgi:hypothetical protein